MSSIGVNVLCGLNYKGVPRASPSTMHCWAVEIEGRTDEGPHSVTADLLDMDFDLMILHVPLHGRFNIWQTFKGFPLLCQYI